MPRDLSTPICFMCREALPSQDAVFDSICGHERCPTMSFHGICLMQWRERREEIIREYEEHIRTEHRDDLN